MIWRSRRLSWACIDGLGFIAAERASWWHAAFRAACCKNSIYGNVSQEATGSRYNFGCMASEIPQEQLQRIRPLVDQFLSAFQNLELTIPLDTESALTYRPDLQDEQ